MLILDFLPTAAAVTPRVATDIVKAIQTREGAGFIVSRPFPTRKFDNYDPFLLVDHFGPVHYEPNEAVGAPWHPHRGFETISYILKGEMQHRDSLGNSGSLRAGDVQWMTAGSGIIHDEEPSDAMKKLGGDMEGFQIWVNLPAKSKMMAPRYQDVSKEKIPTFAGDKFSVRVISGQFETAKAVVDTIIPVTYLDIWAEKGAHIEYEVSEELNAMVYLYRGAATVAGRDAIFRDLVLLPANQGRKLVIDVTADEGARMLLLGGKPIGEPVARQGPFVMNTQEEIHQAFRDYQNGKFTMQKAEMKSKTEHSTAYDPKTASIV